MPVWKLDELQLVAAHIRENTNEKFLKEALTPEQVRDRYFRFGGIFRYVIPANESILRTAESHQELALVNAKAVDTFIRGIDIEKRDDNKDNISHYLLQYDVNEKTFLNFTMMIASEHIQTKLDTQTPNHTDLYGSINELIHMFRGGRKASPLLFEYVVFHMLVSKCFEWTIWNGDGWVKRDFTFSSNKVVAFYEEEEKLKNMEIGVLYRPVDPQFPAVDMVWAEGNNSGQREYFGIQVTFAESHAKNKSVYEKLYVRLGLTTENRLNIYMVTNPMYAEAYAKLKKEQFFTPQVEFQYNLKFATIRSKDFDKLLH